MNEKPNICQLCKKIVKNKREIQIHHIDFNHYNDVEDNRIYLCWSCHGKVHVNGQTNVNKNLKHKQKWYDILKELIE